MIDPANKKNPYTLFVRPRDLEMETWYGRREGVEGAVKNYKARIKLCRSKNSMPNLPKLLDGHDKLYYRFGVDHKLDQTILQYLSGQRFRRLKTAYPPHTIIDPTILIHEMRLHKTPEEVEFMQTAATIAAEAHILAMQKIKPGMNEFQVESLIEAYMRDNGATGVAYNSIIGGGENATHSALRRKQSPAQRRRSDPDRRGRGISRLRVGYHAHISRQREIYKTAARSLRRRARRAERMRRSDQKQATPSNSGRNFRSSF